MLKFLTGAAAIALVASAAVADPGGGKGGGQGGGKGGGGGGGDHAAHAQQAPGGGNGKGGGNAKASKGNGGGDRQARSDGRGQGAQARGNDRVEIRGNSNGKGGEKVRQADRGPDRKAEKAPGNGNGKGSAVVRDARGKDRIREVRDDVRRGDVVRVSNDRDGRDYRDGRNYRDDRRGFDWDDVIPQRARGVAKGCPPGLAKKNNGCMPPGLARAGAAGTFYDSPNWWDFDRDWYGDQNWDGSYRYYDGYLVRYDDSGIDGWVPLLGGALSPGNMWPSYYDQVALPDYYQDYYGLGPVDNYRYYDDALYRVDPQTDMITTIAGLLTGDNFAVGQQLPMGYDVYNVPYSYRDDYIDSADANYRYSDGYVYQVDPTTQLIQAAIQLLT